MSAPKYELHGHLYPDRASAFSYARKEGFRVGTMTCRNCDAHYDAVVDLLSGIEPADCQCRECGEMACAFREE